MGDTVNRLPLLFCYTDLVGVLGGVAAVTCAGRALVEHEGDEWAVLGVNPGGLSGAGEIFMEARADFRDRYRSVLWDKAAAASGFDSFKSAVHAFFEQTHQPAADRWSEALANSH